MKEAFHENAGGVFKDGAEDDGGEEDGERILDGAEAKGDGESAGAIDGADGAD